MHEMRETGGSAGHKDHRGESPRLSSSCRETEEGLIGRQMEIQGNSNEHHPSLVGNIQTIEHLELRDSNGHERHEIENPHFISNWEVQ